MTGQMIFTLYLLGMLALTIVIMSICATIVVLTAFQKSQQSAAKALSLMVERAGAIQLFTVLVIVVSALILRLVDLLSADAVISIFSGIAGYVLGGVTKSAHHKIEE